MYPRAGSIKRAEKRFSDASIYTFPAAFLIVVKHVAAGMMAIRLVGFRKQDGRWMLGRGEPHAMCFACHRTAGFVYWVSEMASMASSPRRRS
jgi:hypothetical protein